VLLAHLSHTHLLADPDEMLGNQDCGMIDGARVADGLRESPVRAVLSGHVHQQFDTMRHGTTFLGAPSTFRRPRHGRDPHYTDTGEPPAAQLLELRDDGGIHSHVVTAG
jgi:hypothetical protein